MYQYQVERGLRLWNDSRELDLPPNFHPLSFPLRSCFSQVRFHADWSNEMAFRSILISPRMLADHMPDKVLQALNSLTSDRPFSLCPSSMNNSQHNTIWRLTPYKCASSPECNGRHREFSVVISVNEPDSLTRWSTSTLFICTFNYLTHIICFIPTLELLHEQLYAMNFECAMCTIFDSAAVFLWSQCSTFHVCARAVWLVEADWKRPTSSSLSVGRTWKSGLIQDVRI